MPDTPTTPPPVEDETVAVKGAGWPFIPANDTNDLLNTNDAAVWAATFAKILREKGYENDDWEGWLVGWFANAMFAQEAALRQRGRIYDPEIDIPEEVREDLFDNAGDVTSLIYQLVGAGSVCWEHMEFTGIFQDQRAVQVAEMALKRLHEIADVRAYTGETANSAGGA